MKQLMVMFLFMGLTSSAFAFGEEETGQVSSNQPAARLHGLSFFHIIPVGGIAAYSSGDDMTLENAQGSAYGGFIDMGSGDFRFEVGGLVSTIKNYDRFVSIDTNYVTVPLYLKYHFIGNSHTGLFIKVGAAPVVNSSATTDLPPIFGSAGLGLSLGFTSNSAFILDFTYNRVVNTVDDPNLQGLNGLTGLAGLSLRL